MYFSMYTVFLRSDAAPTIFLLLGFVRLLFEGGVYFFRHQRLLDKVRASDTVTTVRRCQWYAQPLSPAASHEKELYNTNSPSSSPLIVVRNYSHTCACAAYTSCGYYSRAAFISLRALIPRLLFEGSVYSK